MESIPRVLAGRYEVGEIIGRGGMAEVYVGRDTRLSRTVAIKVLRSELSEDPTFHARFHREAQSAAALNHPAIVGVYDTGEEAVVNAAGKEAKLPFIVMEYVEGHTVRELLKDGAAVPIDEAVEIVVGILGALEYAHREGIVHRDIKPGNVMLTPTGQVKVMDFGIARALADQSASMTQTNSVVGTAQYLSPEQARGETVDARSDIYSTGCVLFELLTGRPPFTGESAVSVAYQHVREVPPTPSSIASDIPDSLDRVVMKALAKDKNSRYADAAAFRSDLLTVIHGGRVSAPATTAWAAAPVPPAAATQVVSPPAAETSTMTAAPLDDEDEPGSRWWVWALVGVAIVAGALAWWFFLRDTGPADEALTVPNVIEMEQTAAAQEVEDLELVPVFEEERVPDPEIPEGYVVSVIPGVGEEVEIGDEVRMTLSSGPEQVAVPDLRDMTEEDALAELETWDLVGEVAEERVFDDEIEEGKVVSSNPQADEMVDPGSTVEITLSDGPSEVLLPESLIGMSKDDAERLLEQLGLTSAGSQRVDEPGFNVDEVVRTSPEVGTTVSRTDPITLYVASGNFEVPDVVGETESDARTTLTRDFGLLVEIERGYSDSPAGEVYRQSPENRIVVRGSSVTIWVSEGPEPTTPPPTTEPTEEPTTPPGDDEG